MGDDITIGVTEIVNNIEVTAQPNDQIVDISVIDNADEVTLNITPTVIEINVNKGSSYARWGTIYGNLTDQTDLTNALLLKADLVDGKVPAYQLPSFVDDVVEVANYAALPAMGEIGKIYVTLDNNKIYRWSGSIYIEIASNNAIWGAITGTLSNQTDLQNALNTKALKTTTISTTSPLFGGGDLSGDLTLFIQEANTASSGYLTYTDWRTFNGKQPLISHLEFNNTDKTVWNNGKGDVSSNTSFGEGALRSNTTGVDNAGFGYYSLSTNTTGSGNVAMGIYAGWDLQTNNNISGTPSGSNSAPVANDDVRFTAINTPTSGNLLTNDYDVDGNTLSITQFVINGTTYAGGSISDIPSVGTIIINTNGTFTFSPNLGYSGAVPIVTYTISDGAGGTDAGVLSIFVVNDYSISVSNNSVFLGTGSRPLANNQNNQIVIGYNAVGSGSDTVTIGNNSITTTRLKGEVQGGSFKKDNGTSSQFLKADGSVDGTTYATDSDVVHKTGAETITGTKTFNNSTTSSSINISNSSTGKGIESTNSSTGQGFYSLNSGLGTGIYSSNSAAGKGIQCYNSSTGTGFYSNNSAGGIALYSNNESSGRNLLLNNTTAATGMPFTIQKQGVDKFTINDAGGVYAAGSVGIGTSSPSGKLHVSGGYLTINEDGAGTRNMYLRTSYDTNLAAIQVASAIDFVIATSNTERMRITSGGNVGIGTTSPTTKLHVSGATEVSKLESSNTVLYQTFKANGTEVGYIGNGSGVVSGASPTDFGLQSVNNMIFGTTSERMRITSGGNVLIGTTSGNTSDILTAKTTTSGYNPFRAVGVTDGIVVQTTQTSGTSYFNYYIYNGSAVGSVTSSGTTTSYNVTSDYRLKQDFKSFNGLDLVSQIKVYDYEWKSDNSRMNGVIAHELQEVVSYAVTGEKDAEQMQQVDYSKLVPILVQAIQELQEKINKLENK